MQLRFIVPKANKRSRERDRFLTKAMGACWHEYDPDKPVRNASFIGYVCKKCNDFLFTNNDFSTLEDFIKLLNWAHGQETLSEFVSQFAPKDFVNEKKGPQTRKKFADALYSLLSSSKRRQKKHVQRRRT